MALIPKKTTFRLSFRNKTKTSKNFINVLKQRKPYSIQGLVKKNSHIRNILSKKHGWAPSNFELNQCYDYKHLLKTYNLSSLSTEPNVYDLRQKLTVNPETRDQSQLKVPCKNLNDVSQKIQTYNGLLFGTFGFCTLNHSTLSTKFIETAKLDISKYLKKKGRVWIRVCCDTPVTSRPVETRMGKGKGAVDHWETRVRPYQMIFEFSGISKTHIKIIYNKLCKKSGLNLKLIQNV